MIFVKNTIDLFTMNYNNEDIPIKINNSSEKTTLNQNKSEINSQINNQRQLVEDTIRNGGYLDMFGNPISKEELARQTREIRERAGY